MTADDLSTRAADTAAHQARARYQSSLEMLRASLVKFPSIKQQLGANEARLDELEVKVVGLRDEIAEFAAQFDRKQSPLPIAAEPAAFDHEAVKESVPVGVDPLVTLDLGRLRTSSLVSTPPIGSALSSPGKSRTLKKKCSWSDNEVQQCEYMPAALDANLPDHGHWLPKALTRQRPSFDQATEFAKCVNGRMVELPIQGFDDPCECVLVEPMGKVLSPNEYVSTGLVVCMVGAESVEDARQEWSQTMKATRWLDAGLSVALPNLNPGSGTERECLEGAVDALLRLVGVKRCLLIGKDWSAQLAVQVVADGPLSAAVSGLILVAPGELVEQACGRLHTPAMLVWAEDDEACEFRDVREWASALRQWRAPTFVKELSEGGHDIAKLLDKEGAAQDVLHFTCAVLLVAELQGSALRLAEDGREGTATAALTEAAGRLGDELPGYLAGILGGAPGSEKEGGCVSTTLAGQVAKDHPGKRLRRAASRLQEWINGGMQQVASATE